MIHEQKRGRTDEPTLKRPNLIEKRAISETLPTLIKGLLDAHGKVEVARFKETLDPSWVDGSRESYDVQRKSSQTPPVETKNGDKLLLMKELDQMGGSPILLKLIPAGEEWSPRSRYAVHSGETLVKMFETRKGVAFYDSQSQTIPDEQLEAIYNTISWLGKKLDQAKENPA